jgi:microcystin-dependent protein
MPEPFIAEIRIFAGNFAPRGWAFCNGQLLPIPQNTALFSIIGTTYGGDGRTTTALPNLQGRAPMHPGSGPGLTTRRLGERGGAETQTLSEAQAPSHSHAMVGYSNLEAANPTSMRGLGGASWYAPAVAPGDADVVDMDANVIGPIGGGQAHNNMQPLLALNYIIALMGLYPSRS